MGFGFPVVLVISEMVLLPPPPPPPVFCDAASPLFLFFLAGLLFSVLPAGAAAGAGAATAAVGVSAAGVGVSTTLGGAGMNLVVFSSWNFSTWKEEKLEHNSAAKLATLKLELEQPLRRFFCGTERWATI